MQLVQSIIYVLAGLAYMAIFGYPVVKLMLTNDIRSQYGHIFVLPVGYMVCCLAVFIISGSFNIGVGLSIFISTGLFLSAAVLSLWYDLRVGINKRNVIKGVLQIGVLCSTVILVLLWPLFYSGIDTYLGAVNPDYFAGMVDNIFLLDNRSVFDFARGADTYSPIDYHAGSISSSGRFASGLFAIAMMAIFQLPGRTALTLSIALFLICLPLSLYLFTRLVLGFEELAAKLSSWLIGIAGSIGLSYIYFYLGQNSGLSAVPLIITVGYLAVTKLSLRLTIFFAILANSLLVVYFGMLPYAIAPLGVLVLYKIYKKEIALSKIFFLLSGIFVTTFLINVNVYSYHLNLFKAWTSVIGQSVNGPYFLEYLTEAFFPYFFGVVVYPGATSELTRYLNVTLFHYILIVTPIVASFIFYSFYRWYKNTKDSSRAVMIVGALAIYFIVWGVYSFKQQYGYAVFKMASWLQFMLVPMAAYGMSLLFSNGGNYRKSTPLTAQVLLVMGSLMYFITNLATTIEYGKKGLGDSSHLSYIVNNFQMSGNSDYFELKDGISKNLKKTESVGLIFVDSIQNYWVSYYMRGIKTSILSHDMIPGEDENLPDIETNEVVDYLGNIRNADNPFFHGAEDDYYLTWSSKHINKDITETKFSLPPVWENNSFRLFSKTGNPNILFTGRGFYRMEYSQQNKPYWEPARFRWTAAGGEFYLLNPRQIGKPLSLVFDAISGYEHDSDARTIELWLGKVKFDEFVVHSAARYITKPFTPKNNVNKITLKIRERVGGVNRSIPLWNKGLYNDYPQLNVMLANVKVLESGEINKIDDRDCGGALVGKRIHECALSFNGLQLDGWIGGEASFVFDKSLNEFSKEIVIRGLAPSFRGLSFPMNVNVSVQNKTYAHVIAQAGKFEFAIPLQDISQREVSIQIEPSQAKELRDEFSFRRKILKQSLLIQEIFFR